MHNMKWINNKCTQHDTMAERTATKNWWEKRGGNTHSFVVTYLICMHTRTHTHTKTKAAIRIGIQQSMHSAMVTMHACYKSPSVRAFSGEMAGVGRLNGTLPGYLCLHFFVQATKREIHLSRGRNRLPGLGQHIATSLSASFEVAATEAHPLSLTTSN